VSFTTLAVPLPIITQIYPFTVPVGQQIYFTNTANEAVTYSLDPIDPAGASITTNGIFRWAPSCQQGSSTNLIIVWGTDIQAPTVSNLMAFQVTVGDCVEVSIGSVAVQVGQEACVPVKLISSSIPLGELQFTLLFPGNQLTNWVISSTNIAVGSAIVQTASVSQVQFAISALSGHSL